METIENTTVKPVGSAPDMYPSVSDTMQTVSTVQPTVSPAQIQTPATDYNQPQDSNSDKKFHLIVACIAVLVLGVGGYFMYQSYIRSSSIPLSGSGTETESISDFSEQPAPEKKDLAEYNYVTPPEGDDILLRETNETVIPKPMRRYDNYQFSFSFEYEDKPLYQTLQCYASGVNETSDNEDKFVFYDSSNVTSNDTLYAHCSSSNTSHLAKVVFTQSPTKCLGTSENRTVETGTAEQCSGKTSSNSSNDSSLSLIIPKDSGTVLVEINDPQFAGLLQDIATSISFETQEKPPIVEGN